RLPFAPQPGEDWAFVAWAGDASHKQGAIIPYTTQVEDDGHTTYILKGNCTSFFAGVRYAFRYVFSPFIMREQAPSGTGSQAVTEGRLQIRKVRVAYSQTGYFKAR